MDANTAQKISHRLLREFELVTSSPYQPRSTGLIERIIQTVKNPIDKVKRSNKDPEMELLTLNTTPLVTKLPRPAELLDRRKMRSNLPLHLPTEEGQKQEVYEMRSRIMPEVQKTNKHLYQVKLFKCKTT